MAENEADAGTSFAAVERSMSDRLLDAAVKQRIGKTLQRFEQNPLAHAEPLKQSQLGSYRFRFEDYRVVFDLKDQEIVVLRVGHRREIYKD